MNADKKRLKIIDMALKEIDKTFKGNDKQSVESIAFDVLQQYNIIDMTVRQLAKLYRKMYMKPDKEITLGSLKIPPKFKKYMVGEGVSVTTASIPDPTKTLQGERIVDKRYRKDKPPRILRRFRKKWVNPDVPV